MRSGLPPRIDGKSVSSAPSSPAKEPTAKPAAAQSGATAQTGGALFSTDLSIIKPSVRKVAGVAKAAANSDADPMTHVNFLASPELLGRGSPSPGLDKAGAYVADLMKKYGLEGANPSDPSGNPYFQTFDLWSLRETPHIRFAGHPWGRSLFEAGFYLDGTLTPDEKTIIRSQCKKSGISFAGGMPDDITPEALTKAGLAAAKVQNVVGIVRGTGPQANEYIVLMAHLDHLGGTPNRFFPGADDNASGSGTNLAALVGLQQLQKEGKLNRSVLVILTAAEEKGLVGANYFLRHPLPGIPLSAIKGSINNDMIGRFEADRMSVIDTTRRKRTFLTDAFTAANDRLGDRKFKTVNRDLGEFESRQDNDAFTRAGIPTVFLFEGLTPSGGEHEDYHRTTDTADKIIRDNGGEKLLRFRDLSTHMLELASNAKL